MDKLNKLKSRKILAVVLCWNNKDIIKPCVDSLLAQTETVEILVVDNGSKDGSYDYLENTYGKRLN
jgi:glycosyltransferase involved in cell wall biosynthesis